MKSANKAAREPRPVGATPYAGVTFVMLHGATYDEAEATIAKHVRVRNNTLDFVDGATRNVGTACARGAPAPAQLPSAVSWSRV